MGIREHMDVLNYIWETLKLYLMLKCNHNKVYFCEITRITNYYPWPVLNLPRQLVRAGFDNRPNKNTGFGSGIDIPSENIIDFVVLFC